MNAQAENDWDIDYDPLYDVWPEDLGDLWEEDDGPVVMANVATQQETETYNG